jgi:hypothetical protein
MADFSKDSGDAESPREDVGQPGVVGAVDVRPRQPGVSDSAGRDYSCLLGTLHLAVNRRVRGACPLRDLSQAKFEIWVAQEHSSGKSGEAGLLPTI